VRNQKSSPGKKAIHGMPKDKLHPAALAVGPCPRCGRIDLWLNDVPLKVFCYGQKTMTFLPSCFFNSSLRTARRSDRVL